MRRLLTLSLLICSIACGCAAGLTAPAALAAGSGGTSAASTTPASSVVSPTATQPSFGLSNAEQNSVGAAGSSTPTTPQIVTVPATSTTSSGGGLSSLDALIIGVVAAVLLAVVAFWVWYDSRRHAARLAHHASDDLTYGARAHAGSKAPRKPRKLTPAERKRRKRGRARSR